MNKPKVQTQTARASAPIQLIDCGKASQVTKGIPFLLFWELAPAPFDRTFYIS